MRSSAEPIKTGPWLEREAGQGVKTMAEKVYLKRNVLAEPLINQWYAWSYLVMPASAAMYITNMHLKIMQSFVSTPHYHVAALQNPKNAGGPFINYGEERVEEIKALLEKTRTEQGHMVSLAEAIKKLNDLLVSEAGGNSLEPFYQKVPEELKGYVELVYDLNNAPSIRLIEGLLYNSPYYDASSQSVALSLIEQDYRPFVFSTPRLHDDRCMHLPTPFSSSGLDQLFRMRQVPQTSAYIEDVLGVSAKDRKLFSSFFTPEPPKSCPRYDGPGVRIRYFGHACIFIESREVSILFDPVISVDMASGLERYSLADLPETIDYVVITHNHQDHCIFETLLQLRHKIKHLVVPKSNGGSLTDPSLKLVLLNTGFTNVIELDEMETVPVSGGGIIGLPFLGEHGDLNIRTKMGYLVKLKDRSILCAADSNNLEPVMYEHIRRVTRDIDVAFIGMECDGAPLSWMYGPLLIRPMPRKTDQLRRLNGSDCDRAMGIINCLHPKQVYIYAMGQEPWLNFLTSIQYTDESRPITESNRLVETCRRQGLTSERLFGRKEFLL